MVALWHKILLIIKVPFCIGYEEDSCLILDAISPKELILRKSSSIWMYWCNLVQYLKDLIVLNLPNIQSPNKPWGHKTHSSSLEQTSHDVGTIVSIWCIDPRNFPKDRTHYASPPQTFLQSSWLSLVFAMSTMRFPPIAHNWCQFENAKLDIVFVTEFVDHKIGFELLEPIIKGFSI